MTSLDHMLYTFLNPWESGLLPFALLKEQISIFKKSDNCNKLLAFPRAERTCEEGEKLKIEVLGISKQCITYCSNLDAQSRKMHPDWQRMCIQTWLPGVRLDWAMPHCGHLLQDWYFRIRLLILCPPGVLGAHDSLEIVYELQTCRPRLHGPWKRFFALTKHLEKMHIFKISA